jgi:hypothetical protein
MLFKEWLLVDSSYNSLFLQRDKTQKSNIGEILGFGKNLVKFSQGSIATLYSHPFDKNLLVKVTSHKEDAMNLVRSQKLKSRNVVRLFPWRSGDLARSLPSLNSWALMVEKIVGDSMVYMTGDFFELSLNGKFELASDWLNSTVHKRQNLILDRYNKNNTEEHLKLAELFKTLHNLEKFYQIELSDFQDNILDAGDRYVIIDMGF